MYYFTPDIIFQANKNIEYSSQKPVMLANFTAKNDRIIATIMLKMQPNIADVLFLLNPPTK